MAIIDRLVAPRRGKPDRVVDLPTLVAHAAKCHECDPIDVSDRVATIRTTSGSLEPAVWRQLRAIKLDHTTPDATPTLSAVAAACIAVAAQHPTDLATAIQEQS